jgi:hypothetical protein
VATLSSFLHLLPLLLRDLTQGVWLLSALDLEDKAVQQKVGAAGACEAVVAALEAHGAKNATLAEKVWCSCSCPWPYLLFTWIDR